MEATATQREWLTKEEAAERLGVKVRRALALAADGSLKTMKVRDEDHGQVKTLIHAGSIERYLTEREAPKDEPAAKQSTNKERVAALMQSMRNYPDSEPPENSVASYVGPAFWKAVLEGAKGAMTEPAHLWLTVKEAVQYSGLPTSMVLNLIVTGKLQAMNVGKGSRGGQWRICKAVLEELR